MVPFSFAGRDWQLIDGRALFWPAQSALLVADLHLEKASFFAKSGQMLPPYDSRETLSRLARAQQVTGAQRIFCLGDSFHDTPGQLRLDSETSAQLQALTTRLEWWWITGNHDSQLTTQHGGNITPELQRDGIHLRHEAEAGCSGFEISGHFHPKFRITQRGRAIARRCLVASETRLILPAFGSFTGGLAADDPAILAALQPARHITALVPSDGRMLRFVLGEQAQHCGAAAPQAQGS